MGRVRREQITSALQLIEPMGDMIETLHKIILAHHPAAIDADDCPVCSAFAAEMVPILDRWTDVRSQVMEHWDV